MTAMIPARQMADRGRRFVGPRLSRSAPDRPQLDDDDTSKSTYPSTSATTPLSRPVVRDFFNSLLVISRSHPQMAENATSMSKRNMM